MEYGRHIMEAKFVRDDEYVAACRQHQEDADYWRIKANKAQEDLGEANDYTRNLEARIRELERENNHPCDYEDNRGGKRARYDSPYEGGSGLNSPAPPQPLPPPPTTMDLGTSSYAWAVKEPPPQRDLEDVQMEEGEVGRFPPLPNPQQPWEPRRGSMTIP